MDTGILGGVAANRPETPEVPVSVPAQGNERSLDFLGSRLVSEFEARKDDDFGTAAAKEIRRILLT